ncbi:MAG: hypothetical protein HKP61_08010 [Dactylosporangium sp.]|nr:hypothetical protein [Dactylosporangium sp.]NNJ60881.1 hypothetical protein [Dactylosporangium sp.]
MATEIRADPIELVKLAQVTLAGADGTTDAFLAAQPNLCPPRKAFGNTSSSANAFGEVEAAAADVETAAFWLATTLEGDVDRLYQVAVNYEQADAAVADSLSKTTSP